MPAILVGQFREFDSPRVHTRINSYGFFFLCTKSDALAGDGGVGRERVTVALGSVAFGTNGEMGVPAEVSSVESVRGCGAVDGDRANFLSCIALSAGEARFSGVAAIEA